MCAPFPLDVVSDCSVSSPCSGDLNSPEKSSWFCIFAFSIKCSIKVSLYVIPCFKFHPRVIHTIIELNIVGAFQCKLKHSMVN